MGTRVVGELALVITCAVVVAACGSSGGLVRGPYHRAIDLYDDGDYLGAIEQYRVALNDKPDDFRIHYNMGLAYHDLYRNEQLKGKSADEKKKVTYFQGASACYEQVMSLSENNARATTSMAVLLKDDGKMEEAVALLEASKPVGDEGRSLPKWTLGTFLSEQGKHDQAKVIWRQILEDDEGHLEARTALACRLIDEEKFDEAESLLEEGLDTHNFDFTLRLQYARIAWYKARGQSYDTESGRSAWNEASERLEKAAILNQDDWEVAHGLAETRTAQKRYASAVRYYWDARDLVRNEDLTERGLDPATFRASLSTALQDLFRRLPEEEQRRAEQDLLRRRAHTP